MDYVASHRSLLCRQGFALSKTFGKSMRPLIWGGEHCVAVVALEGEPTPGDLLLFHRKDPGDDKNIVHRLVDIRQEDSGSIYVTRGDNCLGCEFVRSNEIIGRVAEVHRISGFRPWHAIPSKRFAVTDASYQIYTRIWTAIWPARKLYYLLRGKLRGLLLRLSPVQSRS